MTNKDSRRLTVLAMIDFYVHGEMKGNHFEQDRIQNTWVPHLLTL